MVPCVSERFSCENGRIRDGAHVPFVLSDLVYRDFVLKDAERAALRKRAGVVVEVEAKLKTSRHNFVFSSHRLHIDVILLSRSFLSLTRNRYLCTVFLLPPAVRLANSTHASRGKIL